MSLRAALAALAVAALSLLAVPATPSYDPWAWLLWGRELVAWDLSTAEGPSFKPLPVVVCAVLAPLGEAAPAAWVLLARWGAVMAVVLAYGVGRDLAGARGGSASVGGAGGLARLAGVAAVAAVALIAGYASYAAGGSSEGLLLAFALGGLVLARGGRLRWALACGVACALLRVEAWPFLAAYGVWLWRRGAPGDRTLLVAVAAAVPALWLVPEWLGSGDLLRSGSRALVPNPGQPALADVPAWASLRAAVELPLWPVWPVLAALALWWRRVPSLAWWLVGAGAAWIALVAAMAQAGFSGEPRYALPGAALLIVAAAGGLGAVARSVAMSGAAGVPAGEAAAGRAGGTAASAGGAGPRFAVALRRPALPLAVAVLALVTLAAALPRLDALDSVRDAQVHQARLVSGLSDAIDAAGGREALLACGRPYVGHLRGPLLAYALDVHKRRVGFQPRPPGVVFASRRTARSPVEPAAPPGFREAVRNRSWTVLIRCAEYTAAPCAAAGSSPSSSPASPCPAAAPSPPAAPRPTPASTSRR